MSVCAGGSQGRCRTAAIPTVIAFIRDYPDDCEPSFEKVFVGLVDRLDAPTAT
jgi:hypothetical protein